MDIIVYHHYVLHSGAKTESRMLPLEESKAEACHLLNPDYWYQNECYFLPAWMEANLTPLSDECSEYDGHHYRFSLKKKDVEKLIGDCERVLEYKDEPLPELRKKFHEIFPDNLKSFAGRYETEVFQGNFLVEDIEKVLYSMRFLKDDFGKEEDNGYEMIID